MLTHENLCFCSMANHCYLVHNDTPTCIQAFMYILVWYSNMHVYICQCLKWQKLWETVSLRNGYSWMVVCLFILTFVVKFINLHAHVHVCIWPRNFSASLIWLCIYMFTCTCTCACVENFMCRFKVLLRHELQLLPIVSHIGF